MNSEYVRSERNLWSEILSKKLVSFQFFYIIHCCFDFEIVYSELI